MTTWWGLVRSLFLYSRLGRQRVLRHLYHPFVRTDNLAFDLGAHLGDRSVALATLGARVIHIGPQPSAMRCFQWLTHSSNRITVQAEAVGWEPESGELAIRRRTPGVSTLVTNWRSRRTQTNRSVRNVRCDERASAAVPTLDTLIQPYGESCFCKIDVEGHQADVLADLSRSVASLSFEFVPGALDIAVDCIQQLDRLGDTSSTSLTVSRTSTTSSILGGPATM